MWVGDGANLPENVEKWNEWIIEAVNYINSSKNNRGTIKRIMNAIQLRHKLPTKLIISKVRDALKSGIIIQTKFGRRCTVITCTDSVPNNNKEIEDIDKHQQKNSKVRDLEANRILSNTLDTNVVFNYAENVTKEINLEEPMCIIPQEKDIIPYQINIALQQITKTVTSFAQPRYPNSIVFGKQELLTWYTSPFPSEYAYTSKLFFCEFCLEYRKTLNLLSAHENECNWQRPPGRQIYHCQNLSVYEVKGNLNTKYCKNLCLLAKLFLEHKILQHDVEPCNFYVLTNCDKTRFHLIGYFSTCNDSEKKFNASCIMVMPHYQKQGFGRFLIDFSYLLSRKKGQCGTPEKPLSDLGRISYHVYWKSIVMEYLSKHKNQPISIDNISQETGLMKDDLIETFKLLNFTRLCKLNGDINYKLYMNIDWGTVEKYRFQEENSKNRINIDITKLKLNNPLFCINSRLRSRSSNATDSQISVTSSTDNSSSNRKNSALENKDRLQKLLHLQIKTNTRRTVKNKNLSYNIVRPSRNRQKPIRYR